MELTRGNVLRAVFPSMTEEDSDPYWNSRPLGSRVSACISEQSDVVGSELRLGDVATHFAWQHARPFPQVVQSFTKGQRI